MLQHMKSFDRVWAQFSQFISAEIALKKRMRKQPAFGSMARCENVSYLHKSRLSRGPLASAISPALMREVERGLLRSLGITA